MRGTWVIAPAAGAPVLVVGGWTIAAARQSAGYNPIRDTISSLAALGATDRWVMTLALAGLGACYVLTGMGLGVVGRTSRVMLVGGGFATLGVAACPQPIRGNSVAHTIAATVAFALLGTWPLFAARRRSPRPLLRPTASASATLVMVGLVLWFVIEVHGSHRGLAERAAARR